MVELACRQIRSWLDRGAETCADFCEFSQSSCFLKGTIVQRLTAILQKHRIPARFITLEILEGLALENIDELNAKIGQLQKLGFRVSLDDFGSGYSSLNILGNLKIDEVKLDRDFLMNAADPGPRPAYHGRNRPYRRPPGYLHAGRRCGKHQKTNSLSAASDAIPDRDICTADR